MKGRGAERKQLRSIYGCVRVKNSATASDAVLLESENVHESDSETRVHILGLGLDSKGLGLGPQ